MACDMLGFYSLHLCVAIPQFLTLSDCVTLTELLQTTVAPSPKDHRLQFVMLITTLIFLA